MKFFPQEVERILLSHPAVREAVVFAEPDARFGEVPVAQVAVDSRQPPTLQRDLLDCCQRNLASFKIPRRIEFVSAVRRTGSGKVLHRRTPQSELVLTTS